jgi:16S rRNA (guanine527-N7)-methyltransferase
VRLDALAARYGLEDRSVSRFTVLLERLADPAAPTAVHDPAQAVAVHLADSLVALELPAVRGARRLADLGAGAGLPGLVLAAALPGCAVALVESAGRKAAFIAETAGAMGLENVEVVPARAEEWRAGTGTCDVVTARALAALPVLCEYAAPLLREGGSLVAWKGALEGEELEDGRAAADVLGLTAPEALPVAPYGSSRNRHLVVARKAGPTPARFPRRAGMAAKRPLSARGSASR